MRRPPNVHRRTLGPRGARALRLDCDGKVAAFEILATVGHGRNGQAPARLRDQVPRNVSSGG
jgi:hypothetical protein